APAAPPSPRDEGIRVEARTPDVGAFLNIDELLLGLLEKGASDLHLSVKSPPMMRVHGDLEPFPGYSALTDQEIRGNGHGSRTSTNSTSPTSSPGPLASA
ncbi:MAG: hypothetical protein VW362_07250, partial [Candidatus Nanopelagicales bacterium]